MSANQSDPKGLIRESYAIEGITESECRSIFVDWALSVAMDVHKAIPLLLDLYGADGPDHPMTTILNEGLVQMKAPTRRGGWRSRPRG